MLKHFVSLMAAALAVVSSAQAQAGGLRLGQPAYGGTGCPAGSASVTLSPDEQTLSILFDQYVVEAGGWSGRGFDRKSCNVAIPVQVPQGYSIALFKIDYRGFNLLPRGARSQFNVEYFFAGGRAPRFTQSFFGPLNTDYIITNHIAAESIVWSACGASTNLRANTSMLVSTNQSNEEAMATVDSADVESGLIYHIAWRSCR